MLQYKKNLLNLMLLGYGGLMVLLIGMTTGTRFLNSDVLFQDGFLVITLDILIALLDAAAFAITTVVVIYGIYLVGSRAMITVYAAFLSITVFYRVTVLCLGWLIYPGSLPGSIQDLLLMITENIFIYTLFDCLRLFIIGFVAFKLLEKRENARQEYNRKARILGDELQSKRSIAFPFEKFISLKNPLQKSAAVSSIVYWTVFFVQYVYYAIMNLVKLDFWHYIGFQIIELVFYAVLACICYCVIVYVLIKLDEKMPKTQ